METSDEKEFNLDEHLNKCRCCFRILLDQQSFMQITSEVERIFADLCHLQLIQSECFSSVICNLCFNDLKVFSNFRSSLIQKQTKLYDAASKLNKSFMIKTSPDEPQQMPVKVEMEDVPTEDFFIDCTPFDYSEVKQESSKRSVQKRKHKQKYAKLRDVAVDTDDDERHDRMMLELKAILRESKEERIKCMCCLKMVHRKSIREHISVVHFKKNNIWKCGYCDHSASREGLLMRHLRSIHNCTVDAKYEQKPKKMCKICGVWAGNMKRHILKIHRTIRNFFCDLCQFSSFFKSDFERHMKSHIKKEPKKKEHQTCICDYCGQEFNKPSYVNRHIEEKHSGRNHICTVCSKSFTTAKNLKIHSESHRPKDLPCEFCGKLFSCMNNLKTHLYSHTGVKFACNFPNCDKKFYKRIRLREHEKSHINQKDFVCNICSKRYSYMEGLKRHINTIHQKLRFFCAVPGCDGNFASRDYYKRHTLSLHRNLEGLDDFLQVIREAVPIKKM